MNSCWNPICLCVCVLFCVYVNWYYILYELLLCARYLPVLSFPNERVCVWVGGPSVLTAQFLWFSKHTQQIPAQIKPLSLSRHVLKYARVFCFFLSLAHLTQTFRDEPQRLPFWTAFPAPGLSLSCSDDAGCHKSSQDVCGNRKRQRRLLFVFWLFVHVSQYLPFLSSWKRLFFHFFMMLRPPLAFCHISFFFRYFSVET